VFIRTQKNASGLLENVPQELTGIKESVIRCTMSRSAIKQQNANGKEGGGHFLENVPKKISVIRENVIRCTMSMSAIKKQNASGKERCPGKHILENVPKKLSVIKKNVISNTTKKRSVAVTVASGRRWATPALWRSARTSVRKGSNAGTSTGTSRGTTGGGRSMAALCWRGLNGSPWGTGMSPEKKTGTLLVALVRKVPIA